MSELADRMLEGTLSLALAGGLPQEPHRRDRGRNPPGDAIEDRVAQAIGGFTEDGATHRPSGPFMTSHRTASAAWGRLSAFLSGDQCGLGRASTVKRHSRRRGGLSLPRGSHPCSPTSGTKRTSPRLSSVKSVIVRRMILIRR